MEDLEARRLVGEAGAGSEEALRRLYDAYGAPVHRFALSRLGNAADAADVVNEVFLEVWRKAAARFRGDSRVSTWLLGIAHHKVVDRLRRRGRQPPMAEGEAAEVALDRLELEAAREPPPGEALVAAAQRADWLRRCLETLSPLLRQALYLAFCEDRPYGEIALILDCPEGTVKTRVFHGRRKLRECLERLMGPEE